MKYIITENQLDKLESIIQNVINSELNAIREESEDWGLGEMDELHEVDSIDKIVIDRIVPYTRTKVYVDIYSNTDRDDFDNIRAEIQYRVSEWVPNVEIYINDIKYINSEEPLNEIERDWRDKDYEEQYSKIGDKFVNSISEMIDSYYEDDNVVNLYNSEEVRLMSYYKKNNELFYNSDINKLIDNLIPMFIWARHGKYVISDVFESFFPDYKVRDVIAAGM